jgi:hypothetical protein
MTRYSERLRDPRWQKKRLEILSRDEFTCKNCFDSSRTLHVHHCYYEQGKEPWEYPDGSLVTLCEVCHEQETLLLKGEKFAVLCALSEKGWLATDYNKLACAIHARDFGYPAEVTSSILSWAIEDSEAWAQAARKAKRRSNG